MSHGVKIALFLCILIIVSAITWFTISRSGNSDSRYSVQISDAADTDPQRPQPKDISRYTAQAVRGMIPAITKTPAVSVEKMNIYADSVSSPDAIDNYAAMQGGADARVIVVKSGTVDLQGLVAGVADNKIAEKQGGVYVLHLPVYVAPGATLVISGKETSVRLDQQRGAFIAVRGQIFVADATVQGWNVEKKAPAESGASKDFRPFLVFWGGSKAYIAGANLSHLGYESLGAYGVSFSTREDPAPGSAAATRPTGWVVDSVIEASHAGLHASNAEAVIIVGNELKNNILYGVSVRGQSQGIVVAQNKIYGTQEKHGVILSGGVAGSRIANNRLYDNEGTGIMVEQGSERNIIAVNVVTNCRGDGLSFNESSHNLTLGNSLRDNGNSGIRVRNSQGLQFYDDKVNGNKKYGFEAYSGPVEENVGIRSSAPYPQHVSFEMTSVELNNNLSGQIKFENIDSGRFESLKTFQLGGGFLKGDLASQSMTLYSMMTQPKVSVSVIRRNGASAEAEGGEAAVIPTL